MKTIFALAALIAVIVAAPPQGNKDKDAVVLRFDSDNIGIDGYNFAYETSNGISHQETAQVNNLGNENEALAITGQYTFIAPDGNTYTVTYTADENGFRAQGPHIPV